MGAQIDMTNKTYYANYMTNDGTHLLHDLTDHNKAKLVKHIRDIAEGATYTNSACAWSVYDESGTCVAMGGTWSRGGRWRVKAEHLHNYNKAN